jgi:putative ABC transport system permease protein
VTHTPLVNTVFRIGFEVDGGPSQQRDVERVLDVRVVTPDYFRTLEIPVTRGRAIEQTDRSGTMPVALLNEAAVRRYFANEDPIGRTIRLGWGRAPDQEYTPGTVVGIAGDVRLRDLGEDATPTIYLAHAQVAVPGMSLVARTQGDPTTLTPAIREILNSLDPNLPLDRVDTMEGVISDSVAQPRFYMLLLVLFAVVALALAAVGIFGVMSFVVAQRKREIGIRMALGAREASVLRMVLGRSMGLIAAGIGMGLIAAVGLTRLLESLLFGVTPLDPVVLGGTSALLALTALAATWLPARRAARLDPLVALRID